MAKVIYNKCFGGYSISVEAVMAYAKAIGINIEPLDQDAQSYTRYGFTDMAHVKGQPVCFDPRTIERHDPVLVDIIEKLGKKANGMCAELAIEELSSGCVYRITEYDGKETVETTCGWISPTA